MKPQTYMNNSGLAVKEAAKFYKIAPENVIILCDDISFDPGKARLRLKGSAGGHNGLKSINEHLGSTEYPRIKIGVGKKPHPDYDLADWVLGSMSADDRAAIQGKCQSIYETIALLLEGKVPEAMTRIGV